MWGNILSSARKLRDSAGLVQTIALPFCNLHTRILAVTIYTNSGCIAEAIREGVQIVDEDDEWEEHHPTNTNRKLSPEFSFPRPPAAAKDSFGSTSRYSMIHACTDEHATCAATKTHAWEVHANIAFFGGMHTDDIKLERDMFKQQVHFH